MSLIEITVAAALGMVVMMAMAVYFRASQKQGQQVISMLEYTNTISTVRSIIDTPDDRPGTTPRRQQCAQMFRGFRSAGYPRLTFDLANMPQTADPDDPNPALRATVIDVPTLAYWGENAAGVQTATPFVEVPQPGTPPLIRAGEVLNYNRVALVRQLGRPAFDTTANGRIYHFDLFIRATRQRPGDNQRSLGSQTIQRRVAISAEILNGQNTIDRCGSVLPVGGGAGGTVRITNNCINVPGQFASCPIGGPAMAVVAIYCGTPACKNQGKHTIRCCEIEVDN